MLFRCAPSWQRWLVAVVRPITDMLSALIYILKREPMLAKATIRAYCDFIRLHKVLAAQRKQIRGAATAESSQIYRGSIVLQYMMGKRTFSKIKI